MVSVACIYLIDPKERAMAVLFVLRMFYHLQVETLIEKKF